MTELAGTSSHPIIETRNLSVSFALGGRKGSVHAVDNVNLALHASETLGLIGESGSGKTTLAHTMALLQRPTSGSVIFAGKDISCVKGRHEKAVRKQIAIVLQDPNSSLDPRMTIRASILEPLRIQKIGSAKTRTGIVEEVTELVGLGKQYLSRYPHELSGGQKQRVGIARALTLNPRVLICDEIVSALDVSLQAGILNLLRRIQKERNLTLVFVSHDLSVVAHMAHKVAVLYLGQIMEVGSKEQVLGAPMHPYTRALIESRPAPVPKSMQPERPRVLEGDIPSPTNPPAGCVFSTRCPFAQERCRKERPEPRHLDGGQLVRCHFAEELAEQVRDAV